MAVRNLQAIERQGRMVAEQKKNERQIKEDNFWNRVNKIKESHEDAVDFADTVDAIRKNGLYGKFDEWMRAQNVKYTWDKKFSICCANGISGESHVYYKPDSDEVCFGWNGCGMCEYYSTANVVDMKHFIHQYLNDKGYDEGLTKMAARLQPFLDAFFKWVETIG